ncbi:MAG: class C sortase [Ruthenibacterium sp.]
MLKKKPLFAIGLVFALGLAILLYPLVSAWISKKTSTAAVKSYASTVQHLDTSARDAMLAAAKAYNAKLSGSPKPNVPQEADSPQNIAYQAQLNVENIMGTLDIPSIDVHLPIAHGVGEEALQQGVGHLPESSLPVGGEGTHAVLSAHCGLPNARLFTDLDQIKQGDVFYVQVLGETLAYKTDQIKIVLPEEVEALEIVQGKDYVTLLTCTPYGVNSHRLLVRGVRVPYVPQNSEAPRNPAQMPASPESPPKRWLWLLAIPILPLVLWVKHRKNKHQKGSEADAKASS